MNLIKLFEEAMTTASAGLGTGSEITDDDMRVPKGSDKVNKRKKPEDVEEATEGPEEDASTLTDEEGDDVADKQKEAQPLQAPDGADSSGV